MNRPKKMEQAFEFFYLFSRFEFAIKALGFHLGDGDAKPNWDLFANRIKDQFEFNDPQIITATRYYFSSPPKKQIIENGELKWKEADNSTQNLNQLFVYLRRVRNNLFHGGKFKGKDFEDPDRSNKLLTHGIEILEYCGEVFPDIREAINR